MHDDIKGGCIFAMLAGVAIVLIALLGWGLGWFGLVTGRPMAKYQEQTRKEVYDTSRQYEQGTNRDVARYCREMRAAPTAASRKAIATLIRTTSDTYDGQLSADNRACVAEAQGN